LARKKRLTKAQIKKRENIKWSAMFAITITTIALYLAAFIEIDKTQASIDFNRKTLAQLNEDLIIKINSVEKMKRADVISKKAKKIGLVYSQPETLIVKISND
jgi:intein/homing endonuclease